MTTSQQQRHDAHHAHSLIHAICPDDNDLRQRAFVAAMCAMKEGRDPAKAVRKVVRDA